MKFYCIADEDTVRGFRLAGVAGQAVASAPEAAQAVETAMAQRDCAVVILTEIVADGIRPQVERIRFEQQRPLIVEIPGPAGPLPGRKSLRQLAQEAVGIRIEEKGN
ncbi:MAG: V-type ATP synthase subunit F [Verrucomicrobiales bacterium]|nr:V-type ATP synthase subunit F [Verrucomicrobiales bacterium]